MGIKVADKDAKILGEMTQSMIDMHADCERRKAEAITYGKNVEARTAIEDRETTKEETKTLFNLQQDLEVARLRMWQAIHNHFECWGSNIGIRVLEKGGKAFVVELEEPSGIGDALAHLLQGHAHGDRRS